MAKSIITIADARHAFTFVKPGATPGTTNTVFLQTFIEQMWYLIRLPQYSHPGYQAELRYFMAVAMELLRWPPEAISRAAHDAEVFADQAGVFELWVDCALMRIRTDPTMSVHLKQAHMLGLGKRFLGQAHGAALTAASNKLHATYRRLK